MRRSSRVGGDPFDDGTVAPAAGEGPARGEGSRRIGTLCGRRVVASAGMLRWIAQANLIRQGTRRTRGFGALLACTCVLVTGTTQRASALTTLTVRPANIAAVEGSPFTGTVATFSDMAGATGCQAPATYKATITWTDQSTSPGTVAATHTGDPCTYAVTVDGRTFAEEGSETLAVNVSGGLLAEASGNGSAMIADAALAASGTNLTDTVGKPIQATVAHLSDANPNAGPADYTATILWGDGSAATSATIIPDAAGGFSVRGAHAFDRPGAFATMIAISDDGASTATAAGTVTVTAPPLAPAGTPAAPVPTAVPPPPGPPILAVSPPRLRSSSMLSLSLTCSKRGAPCRGVARVVTLPSHSRKSTLPGGTPLGRTLFILSPGATQTIAIPVSKHLRPVLRRTHSVRLVGVAILFYPGGHSATSTSPVGQITTTGLH